MDNKFSETVNGIVNSTTSEFFSTLPFGIFAASDVTIDFGITGTEQDLVNQRSKFDGLGPRFSTEANYDLGYGFSVVGSLSTALIIGEFENSLHLNQTINNSSITILSATGFISGILTDLDATFPGGSSTEALPDETNHRSFQLPNQIRVIPNIDAKLGLAYAYHFRHCSHTKLGIEAGYMINHFFNSFERLAEISFASPEHRGNQTMDVSFDGPYIGVNLSL